MRLCDCLNILHITWQAEVILYDDGLNIWIFLERLFKCCRVKM